jgi:hypothetical protein
MTDSHLQDRSVFLSFRMFGRTLYMANVNRSLSFWLLKPGFDREFLACSKSNWRLGAKGLPFRMQIWSIKARHSALDTVFFTSMSKLDALGWIELDGSSFDIRDLTRLRCTRRLYLALDSCVFNDATISVSDVANALSHLEISTLGVTTEQFSEAFWLEVRELHSKKQGPFQMYIDGNCV